jgi:uncharacterized membrane protein YbhN (UPF0104 family)
MKRALRLGAGLAILTILVWRLGTGAFLDAIDVIGTSSIVAALGIGLLTTVLSAWRWRIVARALGLRLALPTAVADYYRALLLNAVLPGGVLGDVHRAVRHGKDTGNVGRGVRAVMLERFAGQVALVVAAVAVLAGRPGLLAAVVPGPLAAFAVAGVLVLALAALPRLRRIVVTAAADIRRCLLGRTTWPAVLLLSPAVLLGHVALFVVAMRCAGSTASVSRLLPLILLALLAMGLPLNIGGWGPREAVSAVAFGATGLSASQGVTAAVVYGLLTLVSSLPGALVLLARMSSQRREMPAEQLDEVSQDSLALSGSGV